MEHGSIMDESAEPYQSKPTNHSSTEASNSYNDEETGGMAQGDMDPVVFKLNGRFLRLSQLRYATFTLIGIALLWPWNCFLSASAYYGKRFANTSTLIKIYSSTMMSVSTITSTGYNYYLSQVQTGVDYSKRVQTGMMINVGVFIVMSLSCVSYFFIDMGDRMFFGLLMAMVFMSSLATCLAQNGTMALVNVLGSIYANAMMVGQAVAGVLPSIALIVSILLVGEDTKSDKPVEKDYGVFIYYLTASLVSLASVFMLWWVNKQTRAFHGYRLLQDAREDEHVTAEHVTECPGPGCSEPDFVQHQYVPFGQLWAKLKLIAISIFLTFSITLVFPVFASTVESTHPTPLRLLQKQIYIPFIYLVWNLGDLMGRIFCGAAQSAVLITSPRKLVVYAVARLLFIPLFLTCNISGDALIKLDLWYITLQLLFGLLNGQLCTSCFMVVGDLCDTDQEKEAAGGFTAVFLSVGLAVGSVLSYLLVMVVN